MWRPLGRHSWSSAYQERSSPSWERSVARVLWDRALIRKRAKRWRYDSVPAFVLKSRPKPSLSNVFLNVITFINVFLNAKTFSNVFLNAKMIGFGSNLGINDTFATHSKVA